MDSSTHLKQLLQVQLASDASAVRHLPFCLSTLTKEHLQPSSHLTKWTTRIHSLLHSKEPGGRWAGLCLAYKSSLLSQSLMIDSAQSWVGVVLPLLSVRQLHFFTCDALAYVSSIREMNPFLLLRLLSVSCASYFPLLSTSPNFTDRYLCRM
jgi:hypothetical protein